MKKILIAMLFPVALWGCDEGPCADMDCEKASQDLVTNCNCAQGFEGDRCEWREIEKFLGTYPYGRRIKGESVERVPTHKMSESAWGNLFFQIQDGLHEKPIQAEVDGWNFSIRKQNNVLKNPQTGELEPVEVEGYGWIDHSKGVLIYELWHIDCQIELDIQCG